MPISQDYLFLPADVTIKDALRAFVERGGQWWWLLVTQAEGGYRVCSLGSLLPYLTGRTPHIVHRIGECAICSGLDPLVWEDTGALVEEALADESIGQRPVSDLPLAALPVVHLQSTGEVRPEEEMVLWTSNACGMLKDEVLSGVYIVQVKGDLGEPPRF